jgi:hypothetical protein
MVGLLAHLGPAVGRPAPIAGEEFRICDCKGVRCEPRKACAPEPIPWRAVAFGETNGDRHE